MWEVTGSIPVGGSSQTWLNGRVPGSHPGGAGSIPAVCFSEVNAVKHGCRVSSRGDAAAKPGVTARRDGHMGLHVPRRRTSLAWRLGSVRFRLGPLTSDGAPRQAGRVANPAVVGSIPTVVSLRVRRARPGWVQGTADPCTIGPPSSSLGHSICVWRTRSVSRRHTCGEACSKGAIGPRTLGEMGSIPILSTPPSHRHDRSDRLCRIGAHRARCAPTTLLNAKGRAARFSTWA